MTNEVHLYENKGTARKWLEVRLSGNGTDTNKAGIGARVTVTTGGGTIMKELGGGYGHMGMHNDAGVLTFGLGACTAANVEVRWPNQALTKETWKNVPTSQFVELRQGAMSAVHPVPK
jgi:hypothetical protein